MLLLLNQEDLSMLKKLIKNKKAQNTAEYAILISLVVAGIIAMQTYAQRALQARVREASQYLATQTTALGGEVQYEPYYLSSNYAITRDDTEIEILDNETTLLRTDNDTTRGQDGFQESAYDGFGLETGI
jgi:Flp pilus assembly pilin Flp